MKTKTNTNTKENLSLQTADTDTDTDANTDTNTDAPLTARKPGDKRKTLLVLAGFLVSLVALIIFNMR